MSKFITVSDATPYLFHHQVADVPPIVEAANMSMVEALRAAERACGGRGGPEAPPQLVVVLLPFQGERSVFQVPGRSMLKCSLRRICRNNLS